MTPFLISPPFGTHLGFKNATSVLGSFTRLHRPGRIWKIAEFFWQNLLHPVPNGWANQIGLRNPGITAVELTHKIGYLHSLVGLGHGEWELMFDDIHSRADPHVRFELNLGCPNVHEYGIRQSSLDEYCRTYWCGVKLPADLPRAMKIAEMAVRAGARYLHAGNTLASPRGGLSGYPVKATNLAIVEALVKEFPSMNIVGGGGIYTFNDLLQYQNVGATAFSLGVVCFRPWRARDIIHQYESKYAIPKPSRRIVAAE